MDDLCAKGKPRRRVACRVVAGSLIIGGLALLGAICVLTGLKPLSLLTAFLCVALLVWFMYRDFIQVWSWTLGGAISLATFGVFIRLEEGVMRQGGVKGYVLFAAFVVYTVVIAKVLGWVLRRIGCGRCESAGEKGAQATGRQGGTDEKK